MPGLESIKVPSRSRRTEQVITRTWRPKANEYISFGRLPLRVNRYRSFAAEPDAKSALTQNRPDSNTYSGGDLPAAHAPLPATQLLLVQQNEPSFTPLLVQSGSVPKAVEFFLDSPVPVANSI
jgi:hypothetical protein